MSKKQIYFTNEKISEFENDANLKNVEIFRVGEFHGGMHKYTLKDLKEMVANFLYLKKEAIFPNVPVRADHPSWMSGGSVDKIIGYIKDLRIKGEKLVADVEVTEPSAMEKIKRGTYRSRSSEIGMYEDNSGDEFAPVLFGFAFVDIPAVEGLNNDFVMEFSKQNEVEYEMLNKDEFAKWNRKYINSLPDSSFAAIEPAYKNGEYTNKNARHLPFKDSDGSVDLPHLRNALARVNQVKPVTDSISAKELRRKALSVLNKYKKLLKEKSTNDEKTVSENAKEFEMVDELINEIMQFNKFTQKDIMDPEEEKDTVVSPDGKVEEGKAGVEEPTKLDGEGLENPEEELMAPEGEPEIPDNGEEPKPDEGELKGDEPEGGEPEGDPNNGGGEEDKQPESYNKGSDTVTLSKNEYAEFVNAKKQVQEFKLDNHIQEFEKAGKITPATKEIEKEFISSLSPEQLEAYKKLKDVQPKFFNLNDEVVEDDVEKPSVKPDDVNAITDADADAKAEAFLNQTNGESDVLNELDDEEE